MLFISAHAHAATGINQQINFQGRLLNAQGATVPDGNYNLEFKIYQDGDGQTAGDTTGSPAGTLKWTEDYLNVSGKGVVVKNGFLSVQLGSVNPFGASIDWNRDTLWLSMNVAGTGASCTPFSSCTPDGEMVPMKRMSANAYSLNAGLLGGLSSAGFIQNTTSPQATSNFNISGNGTIGGNLNVTGNASLIKPTSNSTTAFQIQPASSTTPVFDVDTTNSRIGIGTNTPGATLDIAGSIAADAVNTRITNNAASGFSELSLRTNAGTYTLGTGGTTSLAPDIFYIQDSIAGAARLLVDGTGKVAIGSSAPSYQLDVQGGDINTSGMYRVGGVQIASTNLSDTAGLARLSATQAFTGANTFSPTTNSAVGLTVNATTGTTAVGAIINQAKTADTIQINSTNTSSTQTNGLLFNRNGAGGTTTNGINITNTAGTLANGLSFTGTIGTDLVRGSGTLTANGAGGIALQTNSVVRATFDTANNLYLGNGITNTAPSNFSVSGTGSSATGVAGGTLALQGGNATSGSANGGNLNLTGGTGIGSGANGLVVISTPTFSTTANDANCYTGGALVASSCVITASSVNNSSAIIVGFSTATKTATLPDPTTTTAGRIIYLTAANGSQDFTLIVNGGGTGNTIAMRQNTSATMIWNGTDWTAAGASSSTTLQSAYDNTLQSAGGAELIVSKTSNTNGLTIRDSSTNPVNGTLVSVQTASAAVLFSVNSNVTEYSTDGGAETAGGTSSTFPASTWANVGGGTTSRYTTVGNNIATGQASVSVVTGATANDGTKDTLSTTLTANTHYNVSFAARLSSGIFTDMNVYYSVDGTTASVPCTTSQAVATSVSTKVNCTFTAPSSGITSTNAILIRQTAGTARTFYVDNLSVTIAADYNYATDGGVDDNTNFATNWSFVNATSGAGSVTRNTVDGNDASDSASVTLTTGAANAGLRNKLSINPLASTLYRITAYAKVSSGTFNDFKIRYSPIGSTASAGTYIDCADYNTQTLSTSDWTKITCYINTDATAVTTPYVNFVETTSSARTFMVDTFSMTLASNATPNVQVGGGVNGGPVTLFTLDKGASAPIASNNDALLGSMYYDTTLGKLQCYEADGWGACGSSPDNIVTISPEYTNAVLHGTGVGTMTSDICSGTLDINDGTSGQPTICASTETYNFYKWTSPQPSAQSYSIYVTYQLPDTFKGFSSGQTSLLGRTDSTNATVNYQVYRSDSSGLTQCGTTVAVSTGAQSSWQPGPATGAADPSTCSFAPGNSIVFKINVTASNNANAYVGNLGFTFSNK